MIEEWVWAWREDFYIDGRMQSHCILPHPQEDPVGEIQGMKGLG